MGVRYLIIGANIFSHFQVDFIPNCTSSWFYLNYKQVIIQSPVKGKCMLLVLLLPENIGGMTGGIYALFEFDVCTN